MHYHPSNGYPGYNYSQNRNPQNNNYSQPPQNSGLPYAENQQYHVYYPSFPGMPYMYGYQQPRSHHIPERSMLTDPKTESKPRLSKEEVEKLEKVFQDNPKPSSSTKGSLADSLGLDRPRINNWFQNRRAKAKQERKQEEYEARRAAEKASCEPVSPDDGLSSGTSEHTNDSVRRRVQPSSARFPDVDSSAQIDASYDDDSDSDGESPDSGDSHSPHEAHAADEVADSYLNFSDVTDFNAYQHAPQSYSHSGNVNGFTSYISPEHLDHNEQSTVAGNSLPSPEEQCATNDHNSSQFSPMLDGGYSGAHITPFLQSQPTFTTPRMNGSPIHSMQGHGDGLHTPISEGQTPTTMVHQGIPTPDSFKSPPPPANIASRRNIPRPAALQTSSLRSRSYGYGGMPKTGLDGPKRMDPSSPVSTIRRIVSSAGSMHGRIQKPSSGPRSPMVYNAEALLAYQSRSPAGAVASAFSGAAPPTPMTPAVIDQGIREPVVTSACSEDNSFLLGANLPTSMMEFKTESNLKTPPSTPGGLLNHFNNTNYPNSFVPRLDFQPDQPVLTPFFSTEFPDMSLHTVPSYADMSDGSLPTTPLYPMGSIQEQNAFGHNTMGNTQFDWDANEAVSSSRSSPNQSRSKQIQFTQNMTPQDYTTHMDK
ncbi:hypothetical protein F4781DRAFT_366728 [Annulohypoxylon bovei var. microspora]|nr:hypothetical protein F4781DRAFT_366728 [Annulohypoxylon bovei var. microspora]